MQPGAARVAPTGFQHSGHLSCFLRLLPRDRGFTAEFLDADPPCFALGLVEVGDVRCALVALRPEQSIPRHVTDDGFAFGHSLIGGDG